MVTVPSIKFSFPSSHLLIPMLIQQQLYKMQFQTFIIHLLQAINRIKLAPDVLCTSKAISRSIMKYQDYYLSAVSTAIFSDSVTCKCLFIWTYRPCHITERPSDKFSIISFPHFWELEYVSIWSNIMRCPRSNISDAPDYWFLLLMSITPYTFTAFWGPWTLPLPWLTCSLVQLCTVLSTDHPSQ